MVSVRSIWISQRVITDLGEIGTVISTGWPDEIEDTMLPIATVELDSGEIVDRFIRDIQMVSLDGEDA